MLTYFHVIYSQFTLNIDSCFFLRNLTDDNEIYLKTACIDATVKNYYEHEKNCISKGMTLININNAAVQSALYDFTTEKISRGTVWINGKRLNATSRWLAYTPEETHIYGGLDWYDSKFRDERNCLSWSVEGAGHYQVKPIGCPNRSWAICEFYYRTKTRIFGRKKLRN